MFEIVPQTTILSNFPSPADLVTPLQCPPPPPPFLCPPSSLPILRLPVVATNGSKRGNLSFLFFWVLFCFVFFAHFVRVFVGFSSVLWMPESVLLLLLLLGYFGVVTFNALL